MLHARGLATTKQQGPARRLEFMPMLRQKLRNWYAKDDGNPLDVVDGGCVLDALRRR
jgi:hypothetical protein